MLPELKTAKSTNSTALARAASRFRREKQPTRIGLVVDATGSRAATWEQAQQTQARMFRALGRRSRLSLRLVHFGGGEISDSGWADSARQIACEMAGVRCRGGLTQIADSLMLFTGTGGPANAKAIILIGDSFEEEFAAAERVGAVLKTASTKVFSFLEGEDLAAEEAFRRLAAMTGGRFARFGDELPLRALCEGVALLTAGRSADLKRLENRAVRRLLAPPK